MATIPLNLPIDGMTCAACAPRIEHALQTFPGVQTAHVNFATEKATLHYAPGALNTEQLVDHIADIGYQVRSERLTVPVSGTQCTSCAASIERVLQMQVSSPWQILRSHTQRSGDSPVRSETRRVHAHR